MTDTLYYRSENVVFSEVEDETVLLHTESDKAYGLDEAAAFVWDQLGDEGKSCAQLVDVIMATYEVDRDRASDDTQRLLDHMARENLLTCNN